MILATNLRQGIDGAFDVIIGICVQNMSCVNRLLMFDLQIILTTSGFVICIAPTEEICVLALELQPNFAENDRELCLVST